MKISKITRKILNTFSNKKNTALNYEGFSHLSTNFSPELKMSLHQLQHNITKARIYHFQNQDDQNAFSTIVKTFVENDKGCPHILEHLACCGSEKYPVRDPFFNMVKRSVSSYMNAWTGDDFTSYPFSSSNPKDYENLYSVYLDMSLKPLLNQLDFKQEGWRYQLDEEGNRELKGIVFNEMKGAYQDPDRQLMKEVSSELFKGTPYIYDSGGKPLSIINLQYSQLKRMYEYYYHPSNMSFYFYGNQQLGKRLDYLASSYLNNYQDKSNSHNIKNLKPLPIQNRYKTITSGTAQTNSISINYYLGNIDQIPPIENFCLKILNYILLDKSNAIVYQEFVQSGIAKNIGFSGFNQSKMATFTVTLKGIFLNYTCEEFELKFKELLLNLTQNGISTARVQQFVHQFEVNLLTPRQNNGIRILEQTLNFMNHRLDLDHYLNPRPYLQEAVKLLHSPQFLSKLIEKYFINNNQSVIIRQLAADKIIQQPKYESSLVINDQTIKIQQQKLQERQNDIQDPNVLPILRLEDIIKPKRKLPILVQSLNQIGKKYEQYHINIKENINFYRLVFNFSEVSAQFLQKLSLWTTTLNRIISTNKYNYRQLTSKLANHTSGFQVLTSLGSKHDINVIFQFSCLKKNKDIALEILSQIIINPKFEKQHTLNVFKSYINQVTQHLIDNPMTECLDEAGSNLSESAYVMNSYQLIKQGLATAKQNNIQGMYSFSEQLHKCENVLLIEHSNQRPTQTPSVITNLLKYPKEEMKPILFPNKITDKAVTYNYMVNFCTQQYRAPLYLSKQHAHLNLLLEILQQDYLHPQIREKGGAYGSSAQIRSNGTLILSSYMDPNSSKTFEVFENSIEDLLSKDRILQLKLVEAKIKQFGDVDRVKIPQDEGVSQILRKYTQEDFQFYRQSIKNAQFTEIIETGRRYLTGKRSRCIFGREVPEGFSEQRLKDFLL